MTLEELYCGPVDVLKKAEEFLDPHFVRSQTSEPLFPCLHEEYALQYQPRLVVISPFLI